MRWSAGPTDFAISSRRHRQTLRGCARWPPMRDPTINLVTKELIEIAFQYLCERELWEANEAANAAFARAEKLLESYVWPMHATRMEWRPPVRRRGRPLQRRDRHLQIAGAVAMLIEDAGLK